MVIFQFAFSMFTRPGTIQLAWRRSNSSFVHLTWEASETRQPWTAIPEISTSFRMEIMGDFLWFL